MIKEHEFTISLSAADLQESLRKAAHNVLETKGYESSPWMGEDSFELISFTPGYVTARCKVMTFDPPKSDVERLMEQE